MHQLPPEDGRVTGLRLPGGGRKHLRPVFYEIRRNNSDTGRIVKWELEDAQNLSYPDESYDIVFMSHVLHHCANPRQVISECQRVLSPGGVLLIRHSTIEEIRNDPENTFFPEARAINEARIFSLAATTALLREAGFENIVSEKIVQRTCESGYALYEKISNKNVSALIMIPQEDFERGLKRLHEYVQKHHDDPWLMHDIMRMTAGYKGSIK
jgi:SAM-dependent methyltransferase